MTECKCGGTIMPEWKLCYECYSNIHSIEIANDCDVCLEEYEEFKRECREENDE